ncbi:MAG: hypothetical protein ABIO39_06295 [Caulobacteraceae bacterium]
MYGSTGFNVYLNGQRYGGWFEVKDGLVIVSSAYGSRRVKVGKADPAKVAVQLLEEIVAARARATVGA